MRPARDQLRATSSRSRRATVHIIWNILAILAIDLCIIGMLSPYLLSEQGQPTPLTSPQILRRRTARPRRTRRPG